MYIMKKLFSVLLSAILLIGIFSINTFAETEIKGLQENLDELLMKNYFTQEELDRISQVYTEIYSKHTLNTIIPGRQEMEKMETSSVEEEYVLIMEEGKLDYESALRVSNLSDFIYSEQYARDKCFYYLFDEKEYWNIIREKNSLANGYSRFKIDGERIENIEEYLGYFNDPIKQKKAYELIKKKNTIKHLLLENGESEVEDIKFFALRRIITAIYIKCTEQEYLLKTYDKSWDIDKKMDDTYYEFMTISEFAQEYEQRRYDSNKNYVTPTKSTFETEALNLQEKGLLHGNEKGLDLLKPLTRIEAATMLLRALGESTINETAVQTFADVPATHWGYGAAENAYSLGLIKGVGNDKFAPDDMVTGPQFATMVLRAAKHENFNWEEALDIMVNENVISKEDTSTMDFFTRGDMAKIIYEAIEKGMF